MWNEDGESVRNKGFNYYDWNWDERCIPVGIQRMSGDKISNLFNSRVLQSGNPCHPVEHEQVFGAEHICFSEQVGFVYFAEK